MSHESCSGSGCGQGSHHHHSGCCCCGQQHSSGCGSDSCDGHEGDFAKMLLELADEAWMEVLKDKIKQQIEESDGQNLEALAKLVSQSNGARWQHKLAKKKACKEFGCKIEKFFHDQ